MNTSSTPHEMAPNVSPELLQAIGRVAVNFSALDLAVQQFTYALGGGGWSFAPGKILTANWTLGRFLEVLDPLFRRTDPAPDSLSAFTTILDELRTVNAERARVFHSFWTGSDESGASQRFRERVKKGRFELEAGLITADDMDALARRIGDVYSRFMVFMTRALGWIDEGQGESASEPP